MHLQFHYQCAPEQIPCNSFHWTCVVNCIYNINASIVQDSGFGPSSFDVVAAGLHLLRVSNSLSNDTYYLMVPASARSTISLELTIMTRYDRMNIAQGPCVAAREGFEPTTLQSKSVDSTNLPPRPTSAIRCIGRNFALDLGATKNHHYL